MRIPGFLFGFPIAGAAYAGVLQTSRIARTAPDDPPASQGQRQAPALLNVQRITDPPEVAGLVTPPETVSLSAMAETHNGTSSIYELYGNKAGMREAGDLGEALR